MEQITLIPSEFLKLIPLFGGDKRQLNLYIRKCEYVIEKFKGSDAQNLYVMHCVMSRLVDNAAALISEREDIISWSDFKNLLIQHFGDPRNEECIAIELENLRIKSHESYLEFCNRIQSVRSTLISKVNRINNEEIKQSKIIIYNNTALNVFLYNLPEHMVRIVRLKTPDSLEDALSIVLEEVNFQEQYSAKNKSHTSNITPKNSQIFSNFKNNFNLPMSQNKPNNFKFGIPQYNQVQQHQRLAMPPKPMPMGYKPNFNANPQFGYRPNFNNNFGHSFNQQKMTPQQFGQPTQRFGNQPLNQFGYKPPQQFGYRPPFNSGYRPTQPQNTDVSMRSAPRPKINHLNELNLNEEPSQYSDHTELYNYYDDYYLYNENHNYRDDYGPQPTVNEDSPDVDQEPSQPIESDTNVENFHIRASSCLKR